MTRRHALRLLLAALGGLGAAISSRQALSDGVGADAVEKLDGGAFFDAREMTTLAEVADIIVPSTDTPGARAVNVHGFVDGLMIDWAVPDTQVALRAALRGIDADATGTFGVRLVELPLPQRIEVVTAVDAAAFAPRVVPADDVPVHPFMRLKELVLLGYYHSEIGATQELQHRPVPGRYEPCVPLEHIGRAWVESR